MRSLACAALSTSKARHFELALDSRAYTMRPKLDADAAFPEIAQQAANPGAGEYNPLVTKRGVRDDMVGGGGASFTLA